MPGRVLNSLASGGNGINNGGVAGAVATVGLSENTDVGGSSGMIRSSRESIGLPPGCSEITLPDITLSVATRRARLQTSTSVDLRTFGRAADHHLTGIRILRPDSTICYPRIEPVGPMSSIP
jgi:hypothetical protein